MPSKLLLSAVGDSEVANTVTETSIFSGTVPGGTLGTDTLLILRMIGDILNDSGVAGTAILRVKFGGTPIHTFRTISLADSGATSRYADLTTVFLGAENATNAQRSMMDHKQGGSNSGAGGTSGGNDHNTSVNRLIAVDSTTDQTLEVTVQLSAAHAELRYRRRGVWVEHLSSSLPSAPGDGTKLISLVVPNTAAGEGVVRNTTTETSVMSYTIPAGTLGTGNLIILRIIADARNFSGAATQWWTNIYLGGTLIFNPITGTNQASDTRRYSFPVEIWIGGAGATNAQSIGINGHAIGAGPGSGEGDLGNVGWAANNSTNASAIDMSVDQVLEVKVDFSTASPDIDYRLLSAICAVIKA